MPAVCPVKLACTDCDAPGLSVTLFGETEQLLTTVGQATESGKADCIVPPLVVLVTVKL
jgi:hypothetical protein